MVRIKKINGYYYLFKSLYLLLGRYKDRSVRTQAKRSQRLTHTIEDLASCFEDLHDVKDLKSHHVCYLVQKWLDEELPFVTIKKHLSDLRWLAHKINKHNIVHRYNIEYNIAKQLSKEELERISDSYTRYALLLQQAFGFYRSEAIKFEPACIKKDEIILKPTWSEAKIIKTIPIRTPQQRALLDEVKAFCEVQGATTLIHPDRNYRQQLTCYKHQTERYAQDRYREITGRDCPKQGGKCYLEMSPEEKVWDLAARLQIASELGHTREKKTDVYLGNRS